MASLIIRSVFLAIAISVVTNFAEADELLTQLPEGPNTLMVMDATKLLASDMARDGGWNAKVRDGSAPIHLPEEAQRVVVAASIDSSRDFSSVWQAGLVSLSRPLSLSLVARAAGGYADTVNGMSAAWIPSGLYCVEMAPTVLGIRYPSDRQAVARWSQAYSEKNPTHLPVYLSQAAAAIDRGPQMVLAMDLSSIAQPQRLRKNLASNEAVKKFKLNPEEVATAVLSLKGLVMEVTVTDKASGQIRVDFDKPLTLSAAAAKGLVLEGLSQMAADLPGLDSWKATVTSQSIVMVGDLSDDALRRLFSIIQFPHIDTNEPANSETSSADKMLKASKSYFDSVNTLVSDLKKNSKQSTRDSYWQERYAEKIDALPLLNVDPDLLDFGGKTAQTLRVMSTSRTKNAIKGGVQAQNSIADNTYYGYGRDLGRTTHAIGSQALGASNITRIDGYKLISDATAEMRRLLTERYNVEF